jgi:hypothetical protein
MTFPLRRLREPLHEKCGLSRSAACRWSKATVLVSPIGLEDGVIIRKNP